MDANNHKLVILYGEGGLSDVGRHAVVAALDVVEKYKITSIKVLTEHPELLDEKDWNCGCPKDHGFTDEEKERFDVIKVNSWENDDISEHFAGASAVIQCLGNRQPFIKGWVAEAGSRAVIKAMQKQHVKRVVVMSSAGIEEDWPPVEFNWVGKILALMFMTVCRTASRDLTMAERAYRASEDLDFLLVRPVGIGEDVVPVGKWFLQKQKHNDALGFNMAKLDCARFMVHEAFQPSRHREAVVIGSEPPEDAPPVEKWFLQKSEKQGCSWI